MNNDLISREALKEVITKLPNKNPSYCVTLDLVDREVVIDLIDNAPAVEENWKFYYEHGYAQAKKDFERPTGEWIDGTQGYFCSVCDYYDKQHYEHKYCPNCGADMREKERKNEQTTE